MKISNGYKYRQKLVEIVSRLEKTKYIWWKFQISTIVFNPITTTATKKSKITETIFPRYYEGNYKEYEKKLLSMHQLGEICYWTTIPGVDDRIEIYGRNFVYRQT